MKRAAIYIRVSPERQAEKVSPEAQEADCVAYCEAHNYQVFGIYRDAEKYRVGSRLVEPSRTRFDRPQFLRMLADSDAGRFDVLIAWREDRLYRGARKAMAEISERVTQKLFTIELVKEFYDPTTAAVKAWAAGIELQARLDRTNMGIAGHFASGKVWASSIPYGYHQNVGIPETNPDESIWVQRIWEWAGSGVSLHEIRRRFIEGNAPQRNEVRIPWTIPYIYTILRNKPYHTGIQTMKWDNQVFDLNYPVIVDAETAQRVAARKAKSKMNPVRNLKYKYLAQGFIYCAACNVKMSSFTSHHYANGKKYDRLVRYYRCAHKIDGYPSEGCAKTARIDKIDKQLWDKVMIVLNDDNYFEKGIQKRIAELQRGEEDAKAEIDRINHDLENLAKERAWTILQARKKIITQHEFENQMGMLTVEESDLKKELAEASLLIGNQAQQLIDFANHFRAELRNELVWINQEPKNEEDAEYQFKERRYVVEKIVNRIDVFEDKSIKVEFVFDSSDMKSNNSYLGCYK